jgi:hypothetical protein
VKYVIIFALFIFTASGVSQKPNSKKKVNLIVGKGGDGGKSKTGIDGVDGKDGKSKILNIKL